MGVHRARTFAFAIGACLLCARALAFPTSRLTYARGSGAEACPEEPTIRAAVAARLGYDPFFAAADKTIVARILRHREELRATVELVDDRGVVRGVREFKARAGQCDELVATMALAISIAIDPANAGIVGPPPKAPANPPRSATASLDRPAPPRMQPAPPAPPPEADVPEPADQPAPSSSELRAGVALIAALGTSPTLTAGLALNAGIRRGIWSINAEGRAELPGATDVGSGRVRTSLWAGALVPCVHFDPLLLCATAWLGSVRAQGVGFPTSRTDDAFYAATGLRLGFEVPMTTHWTFRPELDLLGTLFPVDLQVDGTTQWVAPELSALLRAGVMARFP
jgi:hypothetical protein